MAKLPIVLHYCCYSGRKNRIQRTRLTSIQKQTALPRTMFCFSNNTPFQQFKNRAEVSLLGNCLSPEAWLSSGTRGKNGHISNRAGISSLLPCCSLDSDVSHWIRALPLLSNTCEHPQPSQSSSPSPNYSWCPLWQGKGRASSHSWTQVTNHNCFQTRTFFPLNLSVLQRKMLASILWTPACSQETVQPAHLIP